MTDANSRAEHAPRQTTSWISDAMARALAKAFGKQTIGRLEIVWPSGARTLLGADKSPPARVVLRSHKAIWRLLTRGAIGLAESYMRGEIDTPDLGAVLRFCVRNYTALETAGGRLIRPRLFDIMRHRRQANTMRGSKRNIAAHYDLGNAFYAKWLDPGMTYSSAIYRDRRQSLVDAQDEKYRVVLDQLQIVPGTKLLEIGCGWGGLAERAIARGATVTGLTLSAQQLAYANARLAAGGLSAQADLRYQDYRDVKGDFDAIASVEMIEAVGEAHWPTYFQTISDRLKPGGVAALQAITIDERYFAAYRRHTDFIQRYIFPGGMLPTVSTMREHAHRVGLEFAVVEQFGQSYAWTLEDWRHAFRANWPEIAALGFDERFNRMWEYYLVYCEVGFEYGDIDVGIYTLRKPAT